MGIWEESKQRQRRERRAKLAAAKRFGNCDSWSADERSYLFGELQKLFNREESLARTETENYILEDESQSARGRHIARGALSLVELGLLWRHGNGDDLFDLQLTVSEVLRAVTASDDELSKGDGDPAWKARQDELMVLLDAVSGVGALRRNDDLGPFLDTEEGRLEFDKRAHEEAEAVRRWLDLPRASAAEVASRMYGIHLAT